MAGKSTECSEYWREMGTLEVTMGSAYRGLRDEKGMVPRMTHPPGQMVEPFLSWSGEKTCFWTC